MEGLSDLKKEKHCEVRLVKLDKVHLQEKVTQEPTDLQEKATQGPLGPGVEATQEPTEKKATEGPPGRGADEELLLCENEVM